MASVDEARSDAEQVDRPGARRWRLLHVILVLGETNGQYNEHCLPFVGERDLSICTYFPPKLTPPREIALFAGDGTLRGFFSVLRRALDAPPYDAVHVHSPHAALLVTMATAAWGRFPRLRSSLVYTVQDSFHDYKLRNQVMMVLALPAFRRVVFCSRSAYESLPSVWKRLVRGRWRVVPNGADLGRVHRALASGANERLDDGFSVISVGRLEPVKDPVSLLDAFARASGDTARLMFVGEGTVRASLRRRIVELGLGDRVTLAGLVTRDEVFRRCAAADLYVSISHGEGMPVAVIEAMAAGCPAILSDIPPHRELADEIGSVPFVRPGDVDGLAREIERFRLMEPSERAEIGERCRRYVDARFSLEVMHAALDEVYRELGSGRRSAA